MTAPSPTSTQIPADLPLPALVWFPTEDKELGDLVSTLGAKASTGYCFKGICLKRTQNQDFWNDKTELTAMLPEGARYGHYTGAQTGGTGTTASNPILKSSTAGEGGLYWIEVMPYDPNAGNSGSGYQWLGEPASQSEAQYRLSNHRDSPWPQTQHPRVLQSTFVRQKVKN